MTKGKMITVNQKTVFLEALKRNDGDIESACDDCEINFSTIYSLVYKEPDRDLEFSTAVKAIKKWNERRIVDAAEKSLLKNVKAGKEISIIFALKAYGGRNDDGSIRPMDNEEAPQIPLEALSPETLEAIQRDLKKYKGLDLSDISEAEEVGIEDVEYRGQKVMGDMKLYDPSKKEKRRPFLPGGGRRDSGSNR